MNRPLLGRLGLTLLAILLTLLVLEGVFRTLVPGDTHDQLFAASDSPTLNVELAPNVDFQFTGVGVRIPATRVVTNAQGFRGPPLTTQPKHRLVCVGDSHTFGWGVSWDDCFCTRVARGLGQDWEPVNLGVPGYNAMQAIQRLELRGMALHPSLVLFFFGSNDTDPPVVHGHPDWLTEHSALWRWVRYRLKRQRAADHAAPNGPASPKEAQEAGADPDRRRPPPPGPHSDPPASDRTPPTSGEAMVLAALDRLGHLARTGHFHAITFFNTPANGKQALLEQLDNDGLFYEVFGDRFGAASLKIPGDGHYTRQGHAAIASDMLTFITTRGLHNGHGPTAPAPGDTWEGLYQPFPHLPTPPTGGPQPPLGPPAQSMVRYPAGPALLGDNALPADSPRHTANLYAFEIDPTEVSIRQYNAAAGPSRPALQGPPDAPATGVDFVDAAAYCHAVNKRLPTAAEWERAARGPAGRRFAFGDAFWPAAAKTVYALSGPIANEDAWRRFRRQYRGPDPTPARANAPTADRTPEGVINLHGNVAEWVQGPVAPWPGGDLTTSRAFGRPGLRWVKGVGITSRDYAAPAAMRFAFPAAYRDIGLGFRCARDVAPPGPDPKSGGR